MRCWHPSLIRPKRSSTSSKHWKQAPRRYPHMTERESPWKSRTPREAPKSRQEPPRHEPAPRVHRERGPVVETAAADAPPRERHDGELRIHGMNALAAVFAKRPQAIRKLYLLEARIPQLQPLLKWCVANRVGYRVVENADLQKLA